MLPALIALLSLATSQSPAGVTHRSERTDSYVQVIGTRFALRGRPFRFVGANVAVMHGERERRDAVKTLQAAARDGLTVVRVWAIGEQPVRAPEWFRRWQALRLGPRGWLPHAVRHLDRVLDTARRLGLKVILVLANQWPDYGGIPAYLRWARLGDGGLYGDLDRFYRDARTRRWYRWHLERLAQRRNAISGIRYGDDPTIFAWELVNESRVTPSGRRARRRFVRQMARRLRRLAPHHLVGSGVQLYETLAERAEWLAVCRLPEVSYCDAHLYPEDTLRLRRLRDMRHIVDDRVQLAHYVARKPLLFGEFGFSDALARRRDLPRALRRPRAWWMDRFLARVHADGAAGALAWVYLPHGPNARRFPIYTDHRSTEPLRAVLRRWARRFRSGGQTPIPRRIGPRFGARPRFEVPFTVTRRPPPARWRPLAPSGRVPAAQLDLPVDAFARARFESMGIYRGGRLVHVWGVGPGYWAYRVPPVPIPLQRLEIRVRLSSEFPGNRAPRTGTSRVRVWLGGRRVATLIAPPDDGVGASRTVTVTHPGILRALRRRALALRFEALPPRQGGHGVCLYGRRGSQGGAPVTGPTGPIRLRGVGGATPTRRAASP